MYLRLQNKTSVAESIKFLTLFMRLHLKNINNPKSDLRLNIKKPDAGGLIAIFKTIKLALCMLLYNEKEYYSEWFQVKPNIILHLLNIIGAAGGIAPLKIMDIKPTNEILPWREAF